MLKGEKTLWDIAIDLAAEAQIHDEDNGKQSKESYTLFVGSKNAGKTSIILRFLDRDEAPKPTTALEYTFGRRAKGHNVAKDVAHIWELGGGTFLKKLIDIAITADTLLLMSLVIVIDLSQPQFIWITLNTFLQDVRKRVDEIIKDCKNTDPNIKDKIKKRIWFRIGEDHPDKVMLDPFPIPLIIVGGKYDIFQDFDSEKRKIICKTLRFVAHTYGATLQFFSSKSEHLVNRIRGLMSNLMFNTNISTKGMNVDHNKPLSIPAGMDSLQQIGMPPVSESFLSKVNARTPLELWKQSFIFYFPQEKLDDQIKFDDPVKDSQFSEHAVDNIRTQKDEELQQYQKNSERKALEQKQNYKLTGEF